MHKYWLEILVFIINGTNNNWLFVLMVVIKIMYNIRKKQTKSDVMNKWLIGATLVQVELRLKNSF